MDSMEQLSRRVAEAIATIRAAETAFETSRRQADVEFAAAGQAADRRRVLVQQNVRRLQLAIAVQQRAADGVLADAHVPVVRTVRTAAAAAGTVDELCALLTETEAEAREAVKDLQNIAKELVLERERWWRVW